MVRWVAEFPTQGYKISSIKNECSKAFVCIMKTNINWAKLSKYKVHMYILLNSKLAKYYFQKQQIDFENDFEKSNFEKVLCTYIST